MKLKTSITLSEDLLKKVENEGRKGESRSEIIERLLRERLAAESVRVRDARDLDIINRNAEKLNQEAMEVLDYQENL